MPAQHVERRTHRDLCQFALELLDEADAIVLRDVHEPMVTALAGE
ncbi:MAG TPA: hypothetical protein VJY85_13420 [Candidatus Limnocylindria bacterium]|nr:hypothetical protein [Candidatus Limnocylindria bacterium]